MKRSFEPLRNTPVFFFFGQTQIAVEKAEDTGKRPDSNPSCSVAMNSLLDYKIQNKWLHLRKLVMEFASSWSSGSLGFCARRPQNNSSRDQTKSNHAGAVSLSIVSKNQSRGPSLDADVGTMSRWRLDGHGSR